MNVMQGQFARPQRPDGCRRIRKGAARAPFIIHSKTIEGQPSKASTLTVFTPLAGGGTMSPSTGLPSTISDTVLPAPVRFTEMS